MTYFNMTLNIRYDFEKSMLDKLPLIYSQLDGWLGFCDDNSKCELHVPYWFNWDETKKQVTASMEPGGLAFHAKNMNDKEWEAWKTEIKRIASEILGYKVGEPELGDCDYTYGGFFSH